jgi:hypothetical protein
MIVVFSRIYSPEEKYKFRWKMFLYVLVSLISKYQKGELYTLNSRVHIDSCDNLTKGKEEKCYVEWSQGCSLKI